MRSTKWSRIPWIGKSVTSVRANSLSTSGETVLSYHHTPNAMAAARSGRRKVGRKPSALGPSNLTKTEPYRGKVNLGTSQHALRQRPCQWQAVVPLSVKDCPATGMNCQS